MKKSHTEVLVVGAGPVGLWTALLLADSGLEVTIIDREARAAARSYACALHPGTLRLLDKFGLADAVISRGRKVQRVAFYDGVDERGALEMSKISADFPFLLILPQSALEALLEERLRAAGASVRWNHRFEELVDEVESVCATVEELEGTSTGYIVPHWETVVKNRSTLRAEFLVGADGHNSMVRSRAHLHYDRFGDAEAFVAFEFETNESPDELRIVLDETSANVLWPLTDDRCRWTFQILRPDISADFPEKERRSVRLSEPMVDDRIRHYIHKIAKERAPWFKGEIKQVLWCTEVGFEKGLATRFGQNRSWLVGDAAHQTGPIGVQSMNLGFAEADLLTRVLRRILREGGAADLLENYNSEWQKEWRLLLGATRGLKAAKASSWVSKRAARILPCLPGFGQDMVKLGEQLGLSLP